MNQPASGRRATLRDVAALARVSHMTVSRVVRGSRQVAERTRGQVQDAIRTLDYRPDPALAALAAYRSRDSRRHGSTIAFLDSEDTVYNQAVFEGARREAASYGYIAERFRIASDQSQSKLSRILYHRGIQGLIFGPSDEPRNFTGWNWPSFAAVSVGALSHRPALHAIAMDYFHGAFAAGEELARRGCRRVAMIIHSRLEMRTAHRWLGGYAAWALSTGLPLLRFDAEPRAGVLLTWAKKRRIDGLMTIHPEIATLLPELLGRTIYLNSSGASVGAAHFALDPDQLGAEAVRFLHPLLLRHEFGLPSEPHLVALPGIWRSQAREM